MKAVIITGSQGFVGGYLCRELLSKNYKVIGIDDYSKYGYIKRDYDNHENFKFYERDLSTEFGKNTLLEIIECSSPDYIIAAAALVGGIRYFHKYPYDILAKNERITANTFDAVIETKGYNQINRVVVISSSMVYEGIDEEYRKISDMADQSCCGANNFEDPNSLWPSDEDSVSELPPPSSSYGFQKLSNEYFAKAAWGQYKIPYTIIRPFNCVGIGEDVAIGSDEVCSGNIKLRMSHVVPDLINKCLKGQDPLSILGSGEQIRCYTHGKDIATGIRLAMESDISVNRAYNISTSVHTTVLELAEIIWRKINPDKKFNYISDKPFKHDVQKRIPATNKAKEHFGFEATISLEDSIDEVISHMREQQ